MPEDASELLPSQLTEATRLYRQTNCLQGYHDQHESDLQKKKKENLIKIW